MDKLDAQLHTMSFEMIMRTLGSVVAGLAPRMVRVRAHCPQRHRARYARAYNHLIEATREFLAIIAEESGHPHPALPPYMSEHTLDAIPVEQVDTIG